MTAFAGIAEFYDAFYEAKNYEGECDFIEQCFARYASSPVTTLLDIGCGTGGHLIPLARRGFEVTGVDRSPEMLAVAQQKAQAAELPVDLYQSDMRHLSLGRTWDAAISMFAVISYLTTNDDLLTALGAIRQHLNVGGLFVFDLWFGPGVFADPPTERAKTITQADERVIRLARPQMDALAQVVTVHYKVLHLRGERLLSEVDEQHAMRFFFPQELDLLLSASGFALREISPFLQLGQQPTAHDWTVSVVAQAR